MLEPAPYRLGILYLLNHDAMTAITILIAAYTAPLSVHTSISIVMAAIVIAIAVLLQHSCLECYALLHSSSELTHSYSQ